MLLTLALHPYLAHGSERYPPKAVGNRFGKLLIYKLLIIVGIIFWYRPYIWTHIRLDTFSIIIAQNALMFTALPMSTL